MSLFNTALGNVVNRTALLYEINRQRIGFLQLDATVSESHSRTATITRNEIEDGSVVADNVVLSNEKFEITGLISEAPFASSDIRDLALQVQNFGFNTLNNLVGSISSGVLNNAGAVAKRITALTQLENFWKNKYPFTVLTGLKRYENVLISEITIPVNAQDGKSLRFTVRCESVRIVESQTVSIPTASTAPGNATKQSLGKVSGAEATANEASSGSLLFRAYKGLTG